MSFFTPEQHAQIDQAPIPNHIAIIPDGNRRWARKQLESLTAGHYNGANTIINTALAAKELGVKVLTIYTFSTENWNRGQDEVDYLMDLLQDFLINNCEEMKTEGIRVKTIGDIYKLPRGVVEAIMQVSEATKDGTQVDMILALNYGSRDEICRAVHRIVEDCSTKKINKEDVTEALISRYLDTAPWKDPDLFIRTSGERRLSNFLLWQLSYTELYTADVLWPDFTPNEFFNAIVDFQKRERRLGAGYQ